MKTTPTAELLATGRFFLSSVTKHDFKGFAIHPFQFFFSSITRSWTLFSWCVLRGVSTFFKTKTPNFKHKMREKERMKSWLKNFRLQFNLFGDHPPAPPPQMLGNLRFVGGGGRKHKHIPSRDKKKPWLYHLCFGFLFSLLCRFEISSEIVIDFFLGTVFLHQPHWQQGCFSCSIDF